MATVLVCSPDGTLSDLMSRNLARRGFDVCRTSWAPASGTPDPLPHEVDIVVADLDSAEPHSWEGADPLRALFPALPMVLLAHDWPDAARLRRFEPCTYVRKPFAIDALLHALSEGLSSSSSE